MSDTISLSAVAKTDRVPLAVLQRHLAAGARARGAAEAALRGVLSSPGVPLVGDELSARIAAMLMDVARHARQAWSNGSSDSVSDLAIELAGEGPLLRRLHAIALEFVLGERLRARLSLDLIVPPLVLNWLDRGGEDAAFATRLVQAQAAFLEGQRRMQLAGTDFPYDLLAVPLRKHHPFDHALVQAEQGSDEARTSLLEGAVSLTSGTPDLLEAGLAIFLSAVASAAQVERDEVTLAAAPGQHARLALLLVAAGLPPRAVERNVLLIHGPEERVGALADLDTSTAAALLRGAA